VFFFVRQALRGVVCLKFFLKLVEAATLIKSQASFNSFALGSLAMLKDILHQKTFLRHKRGEGDKSGALLLRGIQRLLHLIS